MLHFLQQTLHDLQLDTVLLHRLDSTGVAVRQAHGLG